MTTRRVGRALGATVLVLVAGCGGDAESAPTATPASSESSAPVPSATPVDGPQVPVAGFVARMEAAMKDQPSVRMRIEAAGAVQLEAELLYGARTAIRMNSRISGSAVSMLVVGGNLYIEQPNGTYLRIAKDDPTYGSFLGSFESVGPRGAVDELEKGITRVVDAGPEIVDGERLARFEVTVDAARATGTFADLAASGKIDDVLRMSFLLDAEDLIRQISVVSSGQQVAMSFSDWGVPVTIKAPRGAELAPAG